jgi:hypothetical protein
MGRRPTGITFIPEPHQITPPPRVSLDEIDNPHQSDLPARLAFLGKKTREDVY